MVNNMYQTTPIFAHGAVENLNISFSLSHFPKGCMKLEMEMVMALGIPYEV